MSLNYLKMPPLHVPMDAKVPLCINCKYYMPPRNHIKVPTLGQCQKSGTMNVVDGTIEYKNVEVTRLFECEGKWYVHKDISENKT